MSPQARPIFAFSENRVWPEIRICFRKSPDLRRTFAQSHFCGEQKCRRKRVNQKAKPFERGKTLQSGTKNRRPKKFRSPKRTFQVLHLVREQRLSPQVRPKFRKAEFCVWPEIRICFRKTADMRRRFAQSWLCGEQSHGWKEVNQKAKPFERGKTLQSETKNGDQRNFGLRKEFSGFTSRSRTTVVPSSPTDFCEAKIALGRKSEAFN